VAPPINGIQWHPCPEGWGKKGQIYPNLSSGGGVGIVCGVMEPPSFSLWIFDVMN